MRIKGKRQPLRGAVMRDLDAVAVGNQGTTIARAAKTSLLRVGPNVVAPGRNRYPSGVDPMSGCPSASRITW
jgi:hypothetical protein